MKLHDAVSGRLHTSRPTFSLGWTQFTFVLIIIAAVLLLTGALLLPL